MYLVKEIYFPLYQQVQVCTCWSTYWGSTFSLRCNQCDLCRSQNDLEHLPFDIQQWTLLYIVWFCQDDFLCNLQNLLTEKYDIFRALSAFCHKFAYRYRYLLFYLYQFTNLIRLIFNFKNHDIIYNINFKHQGLCCDGYIQQT